MSPIAIGEPVAELKVGPKLRAALDTAREKIKRRCQSQCDVLKSNLQIILTDFCDSAELIERTAIDCAQSQ